VPVCSTGSTLAPTYARLVRLAIDLAEGGEGGVTDRLLDAPEVAELLSVPVSWVREHTRSGAIPHLTLGRYKRYREDDVLAWLEELSAGGGPRFQRYTPRSSLNGPRGAATPEGLTPKE
jgi:excisionase family DNA binding protein